LVSFFPLLNTGIGLGPWQFTPELGRGYPDCEPALSQTGISRSRLAIFSSPLANNEECHEDLRFGFCPVCICCRSAQAKCRATMRQGSGPLGEVRDRYSSRLAKEAFAILVQAFAFVPLNCR
jgi:hypothetical protein